MKDYLKNENGFSLLEVILSIGTLSILSVFILQMFLVSSRANLKAKNMDYSSNFAINIIETYKSCENSEELFNRVDFSGSQLTIGKSEPVIIEDAKSLGLGNIDNEYNFYIYFDKNWEPIDIENIEENPFEPENKDIKFTSHIMLLPKIDEDNKISSGELYNIGINVYDTTYDTMEKKLLVEYDTLKYFPRVGD